MFGDVVDPSIKVGTKQWYTIPLSFAAHFLVLAALIVVPLLATDMLPTPQSVMAFVAAPPPAPRRPRRPAAGDRAAPAAAGCQRDSRGGTDRRAPRDQT
jgi:hypothetical protein